MNDGTRFASGHLRNSASCGTELSENTSKANLSPASRNTKRAVSSLTEFALLVDIMKNEGYEVIEAAGAGYKILAVIQGIDFYISLLFIKLIVMFIEKYFECIIKYIF